MLLRSVRSLFPRSALPVPPPADEPALAPMLAQTALPPVSATDVGAWSPDRLAISDGLWGPGFTLPGGEEEVVRLATPLGLSTACSLLLLGCGSGGAARCLAERLGAWVSGFDTDPALIAAGIRHLAGAGLGKRAQVEVWTTDAPRFPARYYHHALALEPLAQGATAVVLPALAGALRPGSNLVLTEIVVGEDAADTPLRDWLRVECREMPPAAATVVHTLETLGFDIRIGEDITQRHVHLVVRGWRELVRAMGTQRPAPSRAAAMVQEAERWLLRARLMRAGHARLMRWHAIGRGAV